jgi:hypothetical protein
MSQAVTTIRPSSVVADPSDAAAPSSNAAAVVTYSAVVGQAHVVSAVGWSYSGTPTGGNIKIEDGSGNTVLSLDVTTGGAGVLKFDPYKRGTTNTALIVTLAAGGSGVSGKVSVFGHWTEPA